MFDTSTWFSSSCHQHIVLKPSATCCYWLSVLLTSTCCCYWKLNMKTSTSSSTASLSTVIFHCCTTFCFHQVSPASASTASQQNHMKFRWGTSHNCNYESDVGLFFFFFQEAPTWLDFTPGLPAPLCLLSVLQRRPASLRRSHTQESPTDGERWQYETQWVVFMIFTYCMNFENILIIKLQIKFCVDV